LSGANLSAAAGAGRRPGRPKAGLIRPASGGLPGIESFWVGGHTPGSTAYRVNTAYGKVVLTGDMASLLANLERNVPPGVFTSYDECMAAMKKIREKADIVLPGHLSFLRRQEPAH